VGLPHNFQGCACHLQTRFENSFGQPCFSTARQIAIALTSYRITVKINGAGFPVWESSWTEVQCLTGHVRFGSLADICSAKTACPLYPRKRHQMRHMEMSAKGQKRTSQLSADIGRLVGRPTITDGCQLLFVPGLLLNKLRDAFVACGNPKHDCPRFTGFHFASQGAYFFGAEAPKLRVLKLACGHRSTVRVLSPPLLSLCPPKVMVSIIFDIVRRSTLRPRHSAICLLEMSRRFRPRFLEADTGMTNNPL